MLWSDSLSRHTTLNFVQILVRICVDMGQITKHHLSSLTVVRDVGQTRFVVYLQTSGCFDDTIFNHQVFFVTWVQLRLECFALLVLLEPAVAFR